MKSTLLQAAVKVVPDDKILVNMVSQRVRQLAFGARPLIAAPPGMGTADIALTEICEGKLSYSTVPDEEPVEPQVIKFPARALTRQEKAA
jgi:DNA-directed RNA polymerase subunit omega